MITKKIFIYLFIGILFSGCIRSKPGAVGDPREIIVCADQEVFRQVEEALKSVLERELITPQPEKVFYVKKIDPGNLPLYKKHRHQILIGTFDSNGICSMKIKEMLNDNIETSMREGKYFSFVENGKDALGQLRMFLMANNIDELKQKIAENSGFIFNQFNNALNKSSARRMFGQMENVELEERLFKSYKWTMRMQPDYLVTKEDSANNFIWLRRFQPDRMIAVHWKESEDGFELDENWTVETRKFLGKEYLLGMEIVEGYTKFERVSFSGRDALEMEGLWENNEKGIGGFFRSYAFFEPKTKRIYFIDISVFAPDKEKMPFIRQLDIIAHTFSTEPLKPLKKNILGLYK